MQGTLIDWIFGQSRVLRQRAMTAFASLPAERLRMFASQLVGILETRDEEPWVLAAVAAATPYLFYERKDIWDRLAARVLAGDGGAISARAREGVSVRCGAAACEGLGSKNRSAACERRRAGREPPHWMKPGAGSRSSP